MNGCAPEMVRPPRKNGTEWFTGKCGMVRHNVGMELNRMAGEMQDKWQEELN